MSSPCPGHVVAMSSCWFGCFVAFNLRVLKLSNGWNDERTYLDQLAGLWY
jgi:hypothetical protein